MVRSEILVVSIEIILPSPLSPIYSFFSYLFSPLSTFHSPLCTSNALFSLIFFDRYEILIESNSASILFYLPPFLHPLRTSTFNLILLTPLFPLSTFHFQFPFLQQRSNSKPPPGFQPFMDHYNILRSSRRHFLRLEVKFWKEEKAVFRH